jgi:AbrB family looped-hinge helix DNA binding protein
MSTTLTIKGQVTIPKHIRDALGLKPGMPVNFGVNSDGEVVLQRTQSPTRREVNRFEAARSPC